MGFKSFLSKPLANYIIAKQNKWSKNSLNTQTSILHDLISTAKSTAFGEKHYFNGIHTYEDFKKAVPIREYEEFRPYIEAIQEGEENILWIGKPIYLSKTSGTTSGIKYIPISKESISNHINGAKDALLNYIFETGKSDFLNYKLIFLSGSPALEKKNGIFIGRLSGIVNHHVPGYLRSSQMPSYDVNCIEEWEVKIDKIIEQTLPQPMSLISGIPPWVQMYFDKIIEKKGKKIKDIFPHFSLFVYGGVNFEPYKNKLFESIGKKIDSVETYPASEGFIAFQNSQKEDGLLLLLNSGIFYEFVPAEEYFNANPTRLSIEEVELNKNYALIMSTNAGLWAYSIGDTIKFVSINPYKILVTGRIKHFISAFGEHVIGEEIDKAMKKALTTFPEAQLIEFTVAPQVTPPEGLPYHEWLVEFSNIPERIYEFTNILNEEMIHLNTYYKDLITGKILQPLKLTLLKKDTFRNYMRSKGKLGGQNKMPRLSNDRKIAEELKDYKL